MSRDVYLGETSKDVGHMEEGLSKEANSGDLALVLPHGHSLASGHILDALASRTFIPPNCKNAVFSLLIFFSSNIT